MIVEPTSGNTGVGLALVAQQRGYRTIFTLPDKVSESKRAVLRAYGAEVIVTPTDAGPDDPRSYYQVAERLANTIPGGFRPNQYDNPNGPLSHYYTTGPEIWEATDHKVTHFVAGIGTGGTISGTGKYLKEAPTARSRSSAPTRKAPSTPLPHATKSTSTTSRARGRTSTPRLSTGTSPTTSCAYPTPKPLK